jgi:glycosyltransferase involved in cell wall biosynthesis
MRITLFDWVGGGHHPIYVRRFAEALRSEAEVVVAAPDETIREIDDRSLPAISLGHSRPRISPTRRFDPHVRSLLRDELALLKDVSDQSNPDHLVHLYADSLLPYLVSGPRLAPSVSVLIFYPRAHYPAAFQTPLGFGERMRATAKELPIAAWRRRADAHALLTLDKEAARRWCLRRGVAAHWVPEPPVAIPAKTPGEHKRTGCILYGALADRKGVDLLASAVVLAPMSLHITIAGEVNAAFVPRLNELVAEMRRAGATVELHSDRHSEANGLHALASAKCAVMPYPSHDGMSRVLVEACSVGTPVIVHNRGLVGHLVRRHGLGRAVDCQDAGALCRAIVELAGEGDAAREYRDNLARFASRFSPRHFERALLGVFHGDVGARTTIPPRQPAPRAAGGWE